MEWRSDPGWPYVQQGIYLIYCISGLRVSNISDTTRVVAMVFWLNKTESYQLHGMQISQNSTEGS